MAPTPSESGAPGALLGEQSCFFGVAAGLARHRRGCSRNARHQRAQISASLRFTPKAGDRGMSPDPYPLGIIGLGLVGTALATVLVQRGFAVVGHDIDPVRTDALVRLGGRSAASPAEIAAACPRVLLSLPTSDHVEQVVAGPAGLLAAHTPPDIVIDTTTGHPQRTADLAARLAARGIRLLDATIAGSSRQIAAREGVFMVGGDPAAHRACADVFRALSDGAVHHLGPSGSGARAKLVVNLVLGLNRLALAEGLVFAERLGLDVAAALDLLVHTPAYSRAMDTKGRRMATGDFAPEARLAQHRKDVGLILEMAGAAGQDLPLSGLHAALLDAAIAAGEGDLDNSAVIREIRRRRS